MKIDSGNIGVKMATKNGMFITRQYSDEEALKSGQTTPEIKTFSSGKRAQFVATFIVNLAALSCGMFMSWSSSAWYLNIDKSVISRESWSWICSLVHLGACAGAIPTGLISEYCGRRKTLLYLTIPMVAAWTLIASSPNVYGVYVGRFVGGIAIGAISVAIPPYIEDISETKYRDKVANIFHIMFAAGILIGYVTGALVVDVTLFAEIAIILPLLYCLAFLYLPESPIYLMSQGKNIQARTSLEYFRGEDSDISMELASIGENITNSLKNKATFADLVNERSTLKALTVAFSLVVFQQLTGVYPIIFNTQYILNHFKVGEIFSTALAAVVFGVVMLSFSIISYFFMNLIPRRVLLVLSFFTVGISTGIAGILHQKQYSERTNEYSATAFVALCTYIGMYALGVGPIPWLNLRQFFPPNITRRASAILAGFSWFLAFLVTKFFYNFESSISLGWILLDISVVAVFGVLFVYFFVPETKDRNFEDVKNHFEGSKTKHKHMIEVECEYIS